MPPAPIFKKPSVCCKLPSVLPRLSILTAFASVLAAVAGLPAVLLKVTVTPLGMMTLATFDRSGTAPPAQLAGSNQLPVAPPTQVTEFKRVMLAMAVPVVATV